VREDVKFCFEKCRKIGPCRSVIRPKATAAQSSIFRTNTPPLNVLGGYRFTGAPTSDQVFGPRDSDAVCDQPTSKLAAWAIALGRASREQLQPADLFCDGVARGRPDSSQQRIGRKTKMGIWRSLVARYEQSRLERRYQSFLEFRRNDGEDIDASFDDRWQFATLECADRECSEAIYHWWHTHKHLSPETTFVPWALVKDIPLSDGAKAFIAASKPLSRSAANDAAATDRAA
jgi:hypothetical protein